MRWECKVSEVLEVVVAGFLRCSSEEKEEEKVERERERLELID